MLERDAKTTPATQREVNQYTAESLLCQNVQWHISMEINHRLEREAKASPSTQHTLELIFNFLSANRRMSKEVGVRDPLN